MRKAKCCYCESLVPSESALPFFEFRGVGSEAASKRCKNCSYHQSVHTQGYSKVCQNFESVNELEFDSYYCGCRGWD